MRPAPTDIWRPRTDRATRGESPHYKHGHIQASRREGMFRVRRRAGRRRTEPGLVVIQESLGATITSSAWPIATRGFLVVPIPVGSRAAVDRHGSLVCRPRGVGCKRIAAIHPGRSHTRYSRVHCPGIRSVPLGPCEPASHIVTRPLAATGPRKSISS
jgi:hypothetical protein